MSTKTQSILDQLILLTTAERRELMKRITNTSPSSITPFYSHSFFSSPFQGAAFAEPGKVYRPLQR